VDEPEPDKGYYYRSDQLNFARAGIPALYFRSGQTYIGRPAGWGKDREAEYRKTRYHQPSDAVTPEWNLEGMVEDDVLAYRVGRDVVVNPRQPAWFKGDEFEAKRKASAR
jgi:Zn-dependent M28 family amino/carboxypeptidase